MRAQRVKKPCSLCRRGGRAVRSTTAASTSSQKECAKEEQRTFLCSFGCKISVNHPKWKLKKWGKRRKAEELGQDKIIIISFPLSEPKTQESFSTPSFKGLSDLTWNPSAHLNDSTFKIYPESNSFPPCVQILPIAYRIKPSSCHGL